MTAEIGILNKNGLVLAADSAVTLSNGINSKVFNSAKKIFTLSSEHSIGIMIFGNAEIMGVPWEVIIKEYRKHLGCSTLDEFDDYINSFLEYIISFDYFSDSEVIKMFLFTETRNYLLYFHQNTQIELDNRVNQGATVTQIDFINLIVSKIKDFINEAEKLLAKIQENTKLMSFIEINSLTIIKFINNNIDSNVVSKIDIEKFAKAILIGISNNALDSSFSGVVVAGYGSKDIFPSLKSFNLKGVLNGEIIGNLEHNVKIDGIKESASLIPFAQSEMVTTVINGIDPNLSEFYMKKVTNLLNKHNVPDEEINNLYKDLGEFQFSNYSSPVIEIINLQPIEEMAQAAKTFVELTSFKRKIVNTLETVGGPVDVLAISKGDGPIWIERKFYFDINKNHNFLVRKGVKDGNDFKP